MHHRVGSGLTFLGKQLRSTKSREKHRAVLRHLRNISCRGHCFPSSTFQKVKLKSLCSSWDLEPGRQSQISHLCLSLSCARLAQTKHQPHNSPGKFFSRWKDLLEGMCSNSHKAPFEFPKISLAFSSENVKFLRPRNLFLTVNYSL